MALRKFLFQNQTEGYSEEQAATDELSIGKLSLVGVSGVAVDGGGAKASNFGTPFADTDLTTKGYVDAQVAGARDPKDSVRAKSTGSNITLSGGAPNTLDGVSLAANDRVLLTDQTAPAENGLYIVQTLGTGSNGTWVRASDADSSAEVTAGMFIWVAEGTAYADTGWLLSTNDPITLGTTALAFIQIASLSDLVAGAGIVKSGNQIDIELGTNAGLEFDAGGVGGKLQWKPDTSRGLNRDASGAYVDLATTPGLQFSGGKLDAKLYASGGLTKDANGLSILVDATANNLATTGSGLKATEAPKVSGNFTASGSAAGGDGVYISGNNVVSKGDCTNDSKARVIGVASSAISDAASGKIVSSGVAPGVLSGATANTPYYLGSTGQPVLFASVPSGARVIQLGFALNATDLWVELKDFAKKAA